MKIFAFISFGASIACAVILRGSFLHTLAVYAVGFYIGAPLFLWMAVWLLVGFKREHAIPPGLRKMFFAYVIVSGSLVISLGLGQHLHHLEIRATRDYVAGIVPKLDEFRKEHGRYPDSLSAFPESPPPRLLRGAHGYRVVDGGFRFEYWDSAGLMEGYYFDSSTREWHFFD